MEPACQISAYSGDMFTEMRVAFYLQPEHGSDDVEL
jgi:hypothetical protein